ncbi:ubiquitin-like protein 4A [Nilaparvata lugens]|uniref:ubiquitin-like protein 4A n=1 Tax=Nilaparvata lugens TaxID=108931 RepID=UPI000B98519E|nr:ubiquitin-like protein 4A [Nilaparvata lugens]XP_039295589.1 ubiquitin-like protein 4A [Nilaparvata lugens]XP_039299367.1 ubiquitin-like protein 4A [Nilaparvata lugens]
MKVNIKALHGAECFVEITNTMTILELKQMVSKALKVPIGHQKLLLAGRFLADNMTVADYPSMKEGIRIHLVVRPNLDQDISSVTLHDATYCFLRKYYSDSDSQKISDEFLKEFNRSISSLSLDDIERIATMYLNEELTS